MTMYPEFDMPEFRDPDGTVWVWDAESSSYVRKPDSGLEQDRGHSTGGDNDLFNQSQLEHSELAGSPETEGFMANSSVEEPETRWNVRGEKCPECGSPELVYNPNPDGDCLDCGWRGGAYLDQRPTTPLRSDYLPWGEEEQHYYRTADWEPRVIPGGGQQSFARGDQVTGAPQSGREGMRGYIVGNDPESGYWVQWYPLDSEIETRSAEELLPHGAGSRPDLRVVSTEYAPEGQVLCPQCREATSEHVCPICGKDLTPEWNSEADKNNEFMGVHSPHDNTTEHHTFPDVEPKRNRLNTDDAYPSMTLSFRIARKLAYGEDVGQDDWDDFFAGGGKTEIGKWLLDRNGQLHFDHGMHALHETIAGRDGIRYPDDAAALGSVYNDGTADTQRVFPGAQFNQETVQAQIEQAFGPVKLQAPVSQGAGQTKGVAFQPVEITGGQWVIAPQMRYPITGTAWVKGVSQTPYNPNTDILVAEHLQPEDIELWQNGVKAIITATGGLTSHAAYLASTEGIPVVVGIGEAYNKIEPGNYLKIDPATRVITVMPGADASMSPQDKQQISDAYIQYQMQHGGSVDTFGESPEWIKITTATLDNCPECSDVMHDQDGESVCHGCGHKQPIIVHNAAVLAPLGEAAIGGLADAGVAGGAEGAGGLMGGGGISGIGGLMQRALTGNPLQTAYYGDRLMGGGEGGAAGGAPEGGVEYSDPSEMQGVISYWKDAHTAGVLGEILESIVNALQKAPEAFTDPKNPLSYADDAVAAAGSLGTQNQSPVMAKKVGFFDLISSETFGDDEVGTATKNRGENSDPDQQSSSGDSPKEHGDSPEQLKDVDGPGDAKGDAFPEDDLKNQGDPALQEKALKSFHMNLPLVIEFAESPEAGHENPILMALDQLLEEAFPGYKDGHDPAGEMTEHPQESDGDGDEDDAPSEDESGSEPDDGDSKDKKEDVKEASVWHFAYNGHDDDCTCDKCQEFEATAPESEWLKATDEKKESAAKTAYGEPMVPGMAVTGPDNGMANATAPVCPYCGQTHAPGTACPQQAAGAPVAAPTATGGPLTPPQPNTVVTKWHVVAVDSFEEAVKQLPEVTSEENPNAENVVDPHFAFFTSSEEHHEEHEVEHHTDHDSDDADDASDGGSDTEWRDESGAPLQEGATYEMKASSYAIPDRVTIDRILPHKLQYTIHTGDVDYQDEVTQEQLATDGVTFAPLGGEAPYDSEDGFQDYEAPVRPGQDATPQVDDLSTPTSVVSGVVSRDAQLEDYTGSFRGDNPSSREWLHESSSEVAVDPALMAKLAGKDFSAREQREFIDEKGSARNLDRLDLAGTHYLLDEVDAHFNW